MVYIALMVGEFEWALTEGFWAVFWGLVLASTLVWVAFARFMFVWLKGDVLYLTILLV